eukprot:6092641-Amphidinium_carterae.1
MGNGPGWASPPSGRREASLVDAGSPGSLSTVSLSTSPTDDVVPSKRKRRFPKAAWLLVTKFVLKRLQSTRTHSTTDFDTRVSDSNGSQSGHRVAQAFAATDGFLSGASHGRKARPLEPVALEPTPTQKIREGTEFSLSQAAFCKRGRALQSLSEAGKKVCKSSAKPFGKQVLSTTRRRGLLAQTVQRLGKRHANPAGSPGTGAADPVGRPDRA